MLKSLINAAVGLADLIRAQPYLNPAPNLESTIPKNILIFGTMGLGDFIMLIPTIKAIKQEFPQARLTLLTTQPSACQELAELTRFFDDIISVNIYQQTHKERNQTLDSLRQHHFDAVFATYTAPIRFFLPLIAQIPLRVGHVRPWKNPIPWWHPFQQMKWNLQLQLFNEELFKSAVFNVPIEVPQQGFSEIQKHFKLMSTLRPHTPSLSTPSSADLHLNNASSLLNDLSLPKGRPLIALHMGASTGQQWKQWPIHHYEQLCQLLWKQWDVDFVFMGSTSEEIQTQNLLKQLNDSRAHSVVGKTTLQQAALLLSQCRALIGGDSGLGHLSLMMDTPTIRLFGPSDYVSYGLWKDGPHLDIRCQLDCQPCLVSGMMRPGPIEHSFVTHSPCMEKLTVDEVYKGVCSVFEKINLTKASSNTI